jgi:hypothetical protein
MVTNAKSRFPKALCQQLYPLKKLPAIPVFTKMFSGYLPEPAKKGSNE